jgi:hypothetical protein
LHIKKPRKNKTKNRLFANLVAYERSKKEHSTKMKELNTVFEGPAGNRGRVRAGKNE